MTNSSSFNANVTLIAFASLVALNACTVQRSPSRLDTRFEPVKKIAPISSPAAPTATPVAPTTTVAPLPPEPHFDLNVIDADARSFFLSLTTDTDYNIVVHPDVSGKISLQLRHVTVPEVLKIARDVYGYDFVRKGNLFTVSGSGMQTHVIPINYLNLKRSGQTETRVTAGQGNNSNSNGGNNGASNNNAEQRTSTRIETSNESDWWKELDVTLQTLIAGSEGGKVIINANAGVVVVRARPNELRAVRQFLQAAEATLNRQVILEAKIIEVTLGSGFQAGIDWANITSQADGDTVSTGLNGQVLQTAPSASPINGIFSTAFAGGDFNATIELLKTQGDVQVLSSPRIATLNNQKAVIKVGTDEFFVTNVSQTNVASSGGNTSTPQVNFSSFFSGIALDVTPQVSESGEIVLHMHPSVSEVVDQTKELKVFDAEFSLPLALSSVRETDAIVRARSGQVVLIGGLMQNKQVSDEAGIPLLSDIPFIGGLFRQTRLSSAKSELVILLRAVLASDEQMEDEVEKSERRVQALQPESSEKP